MLKKTTLFIWLACLVPVIAATFALAQLPGGFGPVAPPFVSGTVAQVNASYGAILVQATGAGAERQEWVAVAPNATILKRVEADLANLREGDQVTVSGWPSAISVAELTLGRTEDFLPSPRPTAPTPQPARVTPPLQPPTVRGRVISLDPLKVAVEETGSEASSTPGARKVLAEISLTIEKDSKVLRVVNVGFDQIGPGDRVTASGQRDDQGVLTASSVFVNMGAGMGMGMGRGMGPGMGRGPGGQ